MNKLLTLLLLTLNTLLFGQKNPTSKAQPIVDEGKLLYKSEMASWNGTDLFLEKHQNHHDIGGYFSYTEQGISKCIFYSKTENTPSVIGTISFDSTFDTEHAMIDLEPRAFSPYENDLYQIRQTALNSMKSDTFFKHYSNTNFNLIPIIKKKEKKVYVLTGPKDNGIVILGNDYLITFDKKNKVKHKEQLHNNIIPISYSINEDSDVVGSVHSHQPETGDFITATDICTLMLYSKYAHWKTHNVVSKKYLNIWNCENNTLLVVPMDIVKKK